MKIDTKNEQQTVILSASDLVSYLNCSHLTALDLQVVLGDLDKPNDFNQLQEILSELGQRHEDAYIGHLREEGRDMIRIQGVGITDQAVAETRSAMEAGREIIVQAALSGGHWQGRADILQRVDTGSNLGPYSYEIIDTKLSRETKGGTILQLCLYADLLEAAQGMPPEFIHVVMPWSDFKPQSFRFMDYAAFYRKVKAAAENATSTDYQGITYPDPKSHCDICHWRERCDTRRREDDHLCLVAGITRNQINELRSNGFETTQNLAEMPMPLPFVPQRSSKDSLEKMRNQADIQVKARRSGGNEFETLDIEFGFGLTTLPEPSLGDVFFDIEGNPYVGEHGLEYLFGYAHIDETNDLRMHSEWAFNREEEKLIFENFIDFVTDLRKKYPNMHIYHFSGYEPGALKRLMGRYATREDELDDLLRGHVFVDLLRVTRHSLRASVESYSLKKLEPFFGFERQMPLKDANTALTKILKGLLLEGVRSIDEGTKDTVAKYNEDDCLATSELRNWLEDIRADLISQGHNVPRPAPSQDSLSEKVSDHQRRTQALIERLTHDVDPDVEKRTPEQQARWILAHILNWHRREDKVVWWEFFRLRDLSVDELLEEKSAIAHLEFVGKVDSTSQGIPTHRYKFPIQQTELRGSESLRNAGGERLGKVVAVSQVDRTIDIQKTKKTAVVHPEAVFVYDRIPADKQAESLCRLGEYVAEHGIENQGDYKAACDLLMREPIDIGGQALQEEGEGTLDAALRLTTLMKGGVLPIQGPPGAGKSFTGARMICELVKQGKTVGITANSHKVIRNLLRMVLEAASKQDVRLRCVQKPEQGNKERNAGGILFVQKNDDLVNAIATNGAQVAGATHFFWSRQEAKGLVDVLIVDEAGQVSLANVLAVAQAARTVILLGDPQQLEQPTQGTHPDGTGVSALDHLLNNQKTITESQGLFLGETFRLHPDICTFNSELFYEGRLKSVPGCAQQTITADGPVTGSGLRYIPVIHEGNTSTSIEEADVVKNLVEQILASNPRWTDRSGDQFDITLDDILIIAPYNAQVLEIQQRLPEARVGTVDKFQGQEAAIVIYSMATSSHADAPHGMEFLYSANRINVAISRAKCVAILLSSPQIFEAECQTPRQMQLANAFCQYLELSVT